MTRRNKQVSEALERVSALMSAAASNQKLIESIDLLVSRIVATYQAGGKLMFAGNGGSAAEAQHMAAEYVNRFKFDRGALAAISLSTDTSVLTSIANDYSFDVVFSRQLEALATAEDVFIGYTTSGSSPNILSAVSKCKELGVFSALFVGDASTLVEFPMDTVPDLIVSAGTSITANAQEVHLALGHIIAGLVEQEIFPKGASH